MFLDQCDKIMDGILNGYKKINYDRITPSLITKFSYSFDKIIEHCDQQYADSNTELKNKPFHSVFTYIKRAYESFIKRIVGVAEFNQIESILKK